MLHKITLDELELYCDDDETLLSALLRANVELAQPCGQNRCKNCLVRCLQGLPPAEAQKDLPEELRHQNFFLACQCYPRQDMMISLKPIAKCFTEAIVISKRLLNSETLQLTLQCQSPLSYFAGQFVDLRRGDGLSRSYSITYSGIHPQQLCFHIRRLAGGRFSEWAHQELAVGDSIQVSEPQGRCYYAPEDPQQGLLLIGTGSGLAPLAAIAYQALDQGHTGPVHLFHGSREMDGLYWIEELTALSQLHENFHYTPCVTRGDAPQGIATGKISDLALAHFPSLKGWQVYLSGHPEMVNETKRMALLKGVLNQNIFIEAYHFASSTLD